MKVAIRWKGEELKYVDTKDLVLYDNYTLNDYIKSVDNELENLQDLAKQQQEQITQITNDLKKVKLGNIEIVKGLITR